MLPANSIESLESRLLLATFTVTNTNDHGAGSLRQAILNANATAGKDGIAFAVATGQKIISVTGELPTITEIVAIDGSTQPGYAGVPIIAILPALAASSGSGLTIDSGGCAIKGLVLSNWGTGITLEDVGGNVVTNCYIGTDFTGTQDLGNSTGVFIRAGSAGNVIGGTIKARRNLISGNNTNIAIQNSGTDNNVIQGNFIGTNAAGTAALAEGGTGTGIQIALAGPTTIGGSVAGAGNVISGNNNGAISINETDGCTIQGNFIGTDVTGTQGIFNGVGVSLNGDNHVVGGRTNLTRNIISFNNNGVLVTGDHNLVQGNLIGTDITATKNLGNVFEGIAIAGNSNTVGGTAAHAGNVVAFSGRGGGDGRGINVSFGNNNAIEQNSIFSNTDLGIDLGGEEVTPNDPNTDVGDSDDGPNGLQNYPILTAAGGGSNASVRGTLNSQVSTAFRVEFFASPTKDASGFGEGQQFLGALSVNTNPSGAATFETDSLAAVPVGWVISATATDPVGNTSEFSPAVVADYGFLASNRKLFVGGTSGNDVVALTIVGTKFRVSVGHLLRQFNAALVKHVSISLGDGDDALTVGSGILGVYADGGNGNDRLTGGNGNDTFLGSGGRDILFGGNGSDNLNGGSGIDQVFGQNHNDTVVGGSSADILDGGAGTDKSDNDSLDTRTNVEGFI